MSKRDHSILVAILFVTITVPAVVSVVDRQYGSGVIHQWMLTSPYWLVMITISGLIVAFVWMLVARCR